MTRRQRRLKKLKRRPTVAATRAELSHLPSEHQAAVVQRRYTRHVVETEPSSAGLIGLAAQAAKLAETTARSWREAHPPARPIVCRVGCAHCCLVNVRATPPEVIQIADYVQRLDSDAARSALIERIERAITAAGEGDMARLGAGLKCPLLVDDKCSVYPVRPLKCRGIESFDVEACRRGFGLGEAVAPQFDAAHYTLFDNIQRALLLGLADAGYGMQSLDLNKALAVALKTPEAAERWLAGESPFRGAERKPPPELASPISR
ncbi:MAG: YkgJ family cysteine cluster protein [Alphaproteobacteria bacterium]|jgi:hypothetical protein|nr:YkgJ family cysteine cluster protein [Alphaproteobacteria bacterium]MDP6516015.1 YkgJ family cysteine cluster protein [Alphaproteobacteria bacterium]